MYLLEKTRTGIGFRTFAAPGRNSDHAFRPVLPQPEELGFPFFKREDVDDPVYRGFDGPRNPFEINSPPVFDHRDFVTGFNIDRMVCPGIDPVLDQAGETEPDTVLGKFKPFDPYTKSDRPFLDFFRADFIGYRIHAPERCCKNEVAWADQVLEMPEIIDTFRQQPDFALIIPKITVLSLHDAL
jgi:hypothetical protein